MGDVLTQARMRPQLPRTASHGQIHQQNQHELHQLDRTGGYKGCSNVVPVEQRLYYQVTSSRAPPPHAPQGQHEAVPAPGGLHLLRRVFLSSVLKSSLFWSFFSSTSPPPPSRQHHLDIGRVAQQNCQQPNLQCILVIFCSREATQVVRGADSSDFPLF